MEVKVGVKIDNTFVYNIVAKCIVHFNSLLLFSPLFFNYRCTLFLLLHKQFSLGNKYLCDALFFWRPPHYAAANGREKSILRDKKTAIRISTFNSQLSTTY